VSRHHGLALFTVGAFLVPWAAWIPMALASQGLVDISVPPIIKDVAAWGPTLSAIAAAFVLEGRDGVTNLLRRLGTWRVPARYYLIAVLGPFALALGAIAAYSAATGTTAQFEDPSQLPMLPIVFGYIVLLGGPLAEELGWRGFALPRLLERTGPLGASAALGLVWSLWHVPLFFIEGSVQASLPFGLYAAQTVAATFVYTWLFQRTKGSVLLAVLLHAAGNTAAGALPVLPYGETPAPMSQYAVFVVSVTLVGLAAAFAMWRTHRS
jgi:CAAX amino terminal protease family.